MNEIFYEAFLDELDKLGMKVFKMSTKPKIMPPHQFKQTPKQTFKSKAQALSDQFMQQSKPITTARQRMAKRLTEK